MRPTSFFSLRNIIALLILAGASFIGIKLATSIYDKSTEAERLQAHAIKIQNKLLFLRDLQLSYHTVNDEYASDWKSMKKFIDTGAFYITERTERVDSVKYEDYTTDTLIIIVDTVAVVSVKDSLISKGKYAKLEPDQLFKIPESTLEFAIDAQKMEGFDVFEIKDIDPNTPKIDRGKEGKIPYQVGSMDNPTTKGNWEN